MSSVSHEPVASHERRPLPQLAVQEVWAGLAIIVMWLTVLVDALWGPDIVNRSAGGEHSVVPSAVVLALFAFFATWIVARYGFGSRRKAND